jgi:hypothetical protein
MGRRNTVIEKLREEQEPIIEQCKKITDDKTHICSRSDGEVCKVYAFPKAKWRTSDCPMADEVLRTMVVEEKTTEKVRVGQQKQKKKK